MSPDPHTVPANSDHEDNKQISGTALQTRTAFIQNEAERVICALYMNLLG